MFKGVVLVMLVGLLTLQCWSQSPQCQSWIEQLVKDIISLDIAKIPLPSIMYSGINPNSPGQKYECLSQKNYSYFLIYMTNSTTTTSTYSGLCIPNNCTQNDIETVLQPYNAKVYQLTENDGIGGWAVVGIVIVAFWLVVVVVCSVYVSCKEVDQNQNQIKEGKRELEGNDMKESNTIKEKEQKQALLQRNSAQGNAIDQWKLFNYYAGYQKIFVHSSQKSVMSLVYFLAVLSFTITTEFSYRQQIAANYIKAPSMLKNFGGILVCNIEIAMSVIVFVLGMKLAYGVYKVVSFAEMGRYFFAQVLKKWMLLFVMSLGIYAFLSMIDSPLKKVWEINYGKDCPNKLWEYWFLFRNLQFDSAVCLPWLWLPAAQILFTIMAIPLLILFRVTKKITNALMLLVVLASLLTGYIVLEQNSIFWQPEKLFNNVWKFTLSYQSNPLVRAAPFFLGLFFGLFIIEGLEKIQNQARKPEYKLAKAIRRNTQLQTSLHIVGLIGMSFCFIALMFFLVPDRSVKDNQTNSYVYLIGAPLGFLVFFMVFMLPIMWEGKSALTRLVTRILGYQLWSHLERISFMFYMLAPMVIGFTTFSMQSSIYYDADTLIVYLLGDLLIIYILSLILTAAIENQMFTLNLWLEHKVFGSNNKYSVLVVEEY